ncbi:bifunctional sulfate adenylyltransferase/adenylylsulfate kinase [Desulfosarcina ovata]|uniref:Adenylyl-sulfate kinase n=2 Tax=Desulfosarcina ovata TaxID=83564 RepID=A0A5K8A368_9BACT|nr:bifunctional sulfate adenylyltransferase/adenylylsulfate kinase [Desulfosarcina ovata]BBO79489.1 sulfate adenylyltransferase [Desulfosarcina ovata subsp. sediminis]BBO86886.1 sulfate adenylyltransferase [Desulfosarcina ovata subsp. ovata]
MTHADLRGENYHGGNYVNLLVDPERSALLKKISTDLISITLDDGQLCDFELLTTGAFSPLTGFMNRSNYESVLDRTKLQDGTIWPVPICLDISETVARPLEAGQSIVIRDPEGFLLAIMHVEDIWKPDKEKEAKLLYGTTNRAHPGVAHLLRNTGEFYVGGALEVLNLPLHFDFKQLRMTPPEVRSLYKKLGWNRIVGFHTTNTIHRPEFEMAIRAMQKSRANLLLLPGVGMSGPGDFDYYTRVRCYRHAVGYFPPESAIMSLLPIFTRLAGPRDALLQCIVGKNYGCTHFIIGHQHADPGGQNGAGPFYDSDETQSFVKNLAESVGIRVVPFNELVYLPFEDEFSPKDEVTEGAESISLSSLDIRDRIRSGRKIPRWATFPEVVGELKKAYPPPAKQGFAVFFTGLSGAGKSTIARVLYAKMLEIGKRPVTLLDGDIVRQNLSNELSFSKEHRDINVRRIGFVASEITKNRGVAICAPIAPYAATRAEIRASIEAVGGFIEVHVATPLDVCEKRDRKGMYAKARAGLIKGYTGIDDPYEIPESPEVRIDTSGKSPDEAAQEILIYLGQRRFI